jgi:hypothetical protein
MVETWNLSCARALLRMQIDTALRFAAVTLVEAQDDFRESSDKGERIDRIKDRTRPKTDRRLSCQKVRGPRPHGFQRSTRARAATCNLSGEHIYSSVKNSTTRAGSISWGIGSIDDHFPEFSWLEVVECFDAAVLLFTGTLSLGLKPKRDTRSNTRCTRRRPCDLEPPLVNAIR